MNSLFGFSNLTEKQWFNLLVSVQGVGAKAALAIFSSLSIDELGYAISNAEKLTITKADGVGPKIAGRIINELKDKIPNFFPNCETECCLIDLIQYSFLFN